MSTVTRPRTRRRPIHLGPSDHGRRMKFADFLRCDFEEGSLYELARGVVVVTNVPNPRHALIIHRLQARFYLHDAAHPGRIHLQASGGARVRAPSMQSDRHPDLAIYCEPVPELDSSATWTVYIPTLTVEVVSRGSRRRDYVEKAEEYLRIGVREYWILDPEKRVMLVHRRAGDTWETQSIAVGKTYRPSLFPGLIVRPSELLGPAS